MRERPGKRLKILLFITCGILLLYFHHFIITELGWGQKNEDGNAYPEKSNNYLAEKLRIDHSPPSYSDILRAAQEALPSFPILFWEENKDKPLYYKNSSCAPFPSVYELPVNNIYYQILTAESTINVYLYNAYYDKRERCSICPALRLLAIIDKDKVNLKTYCQIWFADSTEPAIVESLEYEQIFPSFFGKSPSWPYLITCPIPQPFVGRIPMIVSLVENICDTATNSLRVIFNKLNNTEEKKDFLICVKDSEFPDKDISVRLVEWIEMVNILGAKKIVFHPLNVHKNMTKVLAHYEKQGLVELVPTTLAGNQANAPDFVYLYFKKLGPAWWTTFGNENLELNDCFYKNMYRYDYIIPLDIDELIIPYKQNDWADLMKSQMNSTSFDRNIHDYGADMVVFPHCPNMSLNEDIPSYMYMLQHVLGERRENYIEITAPKSFLNTELVQTTNNHYALSSIIDDSRSFKFDRNDVELFHYRSSPFEKKSWPCEELIGNASSAQKRLWDYKEPLINRTLTTLKNLEFYN